MSPRATSILSAVRVGLGTPRKDPAAIAAEAPALLAEPELIRPRLPSSTLSRPSSSAGDPPLGTTLELIADLPICPRGWGAISAEHGLGAAVAVEARGRVRRARLAATSRPHAAPAPDEAVAVGLARWGIAEGRLARHRFGAETPILLASLPLHHIVVLPTRRHPRPPGGLRRPRIGNPARRATPS